MNHGVELKRSRLISLPGMSKCQEVLHFDLYYVDEGCGFERSIGDWFRTNWKTFPEDIVFTGESNWVIWNPIVNRDVAKVDLTDRNS